MRFVHRRSIFKLTSLGLLLCLAQGSTGEEAHSFYPRMEIQRHSTPSSLSDQPVIPWISAHETAWKDAPPLFERSSEDQQTKARGWVAITDAEILLSVWVQDEEHINHQHGDAIWNGDPDWRREPTCGSASSMQNICAMKNSSSSNLPPSTLRIMQRAATRGDATALHTEHGEISYRTLLEAAALVAGNLLAGRQDLREARIAFLAPASLEYVAMQWTLSLTSILPGFWNGFGRNPTRSSWPYPRFTSNSFQPWKTFRRKSGNRFWTVFPLCD